MSAAPLAPVKIRTRKLYTRFFHDFSAGGDGLERGRLASAWSVAAAAAVLGRSHAFKLEGPPGLV